MSDPVCRDCQEEGRDGCNACRPLARSDSASRGRCEVNVPITGLKSLDGMLALRPTSHDAQLVPETCPRCGCLSFDVRPREPRFERNGQIYALFVGPALLCEPCEAELSARGKNGTLDQRRR